MTLWLIQMVLNALLVGLAIAWVLQRRRLLKLEDELQRVLEELRMGVDRFVPSSAIETPLGAPTSTLSEKSLDAGQAVGLTSFFGRAPSESYRQALEFLERGMRASEVARRTGLSGSEIQLLSKLHQNAEK